MTSVLSCNSSQKELSREVQSRKRRYHSPRESVSPVGERSSRDEDTRGQKENTEEVKKKDVDIATLYGKTGGAYIPPARLRQMQAQITDKSSQAYQRIAWEALKKSIHGFINKVNVSNISNVVRQLLSENVVRGRGLLIRSLITAQTASPTFTHVFSALVAVINSKFPQVGELTLKRLINEFRKAFRRNQKDRCLSTARFLAHLVNQKVVHELIILELLTLLLEQTTDDSVEVAVSVLKECGAMLTKLVPKGVHGIFEHLRRILNEGNCDKRICYMLEVMFQIRRDGWKDHPIVLPELDLIPEDDQITHTTSLLDQVDPEDKLNVFRFDPDYLGNEEKYAKIRASFFDSDEEDSDAGSDDEDDDDEEGDGNDVSGDTGQGAAMVTATGGDSQSKQQQQETIIDRTETNLMQLRRTIYLMLQSSVSADEGGHRLLQLKIRPGEEYEVASMVLDCCAQTRSYETRYGRLAQRLCHVLIRGPPPPTNSGTVRQSTDLGPGSRYAKSDPLTNRNAKVDESAAVVEDTGPPRSYVGEFERIFGEQYAIIHRLETAKLRNVALFYSHLLYTDSISWGVLQCIRLNERDTTSSGRIFLKHLLLELCSFMGLAKLQARFKDETLQPFFAGLLPKDNPKDTRFAINFLTTIGLGAVTLDLREHLESSREAALAKRQAEAEEAEMSALVELESSSTSSSSSSSSDSDEDEKCRGHRKQKTGKKKKKKSKEKEDKHKRKSHKSASKATGSDAKDSGRRNQVDTASKKSHDSQTKQPRPIDTPFFNDTPNSPARVLPVATVSSSAKRERARNSLSPTSPVLRSKVVRVTQENRQFGDTVENRKSSLDDDLPDRDVLQEHRESQSSPPPRPAARAPSPKYKSSSGRDRSPHSGATDARPSEPHRRDESRRGEAGQRSDAETGRRGGRGRQRSPHSVSSRQRRSRSSDRHRDRRSPPPASRRR